MGVCACVLRHVYPGTAWTSQVSSSRMGREFLQAENPVYLGERCLRRLRRDVARSVEAGLLEGPGCAGRSSYYSAWGGEYFWPSVAAAIATSKGEHNDDAGGDVVGARG